jgi:hypothetical protein
MSSNPKNTPGDAAHALAKGAIGMIPVVGSLASEIFGLIVTPPLEKRRAEWMNEVAEKLKGLEAQQVISIEALKDDDQFLDVVLQATTLVLKTSDQEKIKAFKNALLHTAVGEAPNQTKTHLFLRQLDQFTTWHIRILKFIDDPKDWFKKAGIQPPNYISGSISANLNTAFPELNGQNELIDVIWADLGTAGFHHTSGIRTMMTADGALASRTTDLAKEFLDFISDLR